MGHVQEDGAGAHHPTISPEACPALVLNADYRPLSYYPLSLWSWQDAIKAVFLDRVNIVSEYERVVRSPAFEMRCPSRRLAQDLCEAGAEPRLHPVQRVPARPLHLPILRRPTTTSPSTMSSRARRAARRPGTMSSTACSPCNLIKGGHLPARGRTCGRSINRSGPTVQPAPCQWAACSRPITCMTAGRTISTGIPNSSRSLLAACTTVALTRSRKDGERSAPFGS